MADNIGLLELEAQKRRDRLKGLRKTQIDSVASTDAEPGPTDASTPGQAMDTDSPDKVQPTPSIPQPKFRSYMPKTEELKESVIPKPAPLDVAGMVEDQLEATRPEALPDDVELTNLAPRKPDWDLKRDVAKSLERLDRRTQRTVAELIRERLCAQKDTADLADAVSWGAKTQEEQATLDEW